jgi:hypothetical protein
VLAGLTRRIVDGLPAYALTDSDAIAATLAELDVPGTKADPT